MYSAAIEFEFDRVLLNLMMAVFNTCSENMWRQLLVWNGVAFVPFWI